MLAKQKLFSLTINIVHYADTKGIPQGARAPAGNGAWNIRALYKRANNSCEEPLTLPRISV